MASVVLDAGALTAAERQDRARHVEFDLALRADAPLVTHPFVVAQVWRDRAGRRAKLARFLHTVKVVDVDDEFGRRCGELLGAAGTSDPVDAGVALLADDGDLILTSDADDIETLVAASGKAVRVVAV